MNKVQASVNRKNRHEFFKYYGDLCFIHNINQSPTIKQNSKNFCLSFCGDRIRFEDWHLITKALCSDLSLESIFIWSRYCKINTAFLNEGFRRKSMTVKNIPVFLSPKVLSSLISSVAKCLQNSKALASLKLHYLPLLSHDSKLLSESTSNCFILQHLSLSHCNIGDEACHILCKSLKGCTSLKFLNLSGCALSDHGVLAISKLIKDHSLTSSSEVWSHTLREKNKEVLENTQGLKRITLNQNPSIGDMGVDHLAMVLLDDFSVKAIDLQDCGVSNIGGEIIKCLLKVNKSLRIVDVRFNEFLDDEILDAIMNLLLMENNVGSSQWQWLKMDPFIKADYYCQYKWSKPSQFSILKLRRNTSNEDALHRRMYPSSLQDKISEIENKLGQVEAQQKDLEQEIGMKCPNDEYILIEKNMLLDISSTLQKINFFIRRLNLPQLVTVLKEVKLQTDLCNSSIPPDRSKKQEPCLFKKVKNQEESSSSDYASCSKDMNQLVKPSLPQVNNFDSDKCYCCERTGQNLYSLPEYSSWHNYKQPPFSTAKENVQKCESSENSMALIELLRRYNSFKSQNIPIT